MIRPVTVPSRTLPRVGWWALCLLLALTLALASTGVRGRWPGLVGDEATYLMQAQSLAWDGDLRFAAEDLERFRRQRGQSPEVILQSGDAGDRIVYGKPFLYAAAIAPFVRLLGERGAVMLNALALAASGLIAAAAAARHGSPAGPLWIAVVLFASVAFGHVFWIHPDLFLMACAGTGLALAHLLRAPSRDPVSSGGVRSTFGWFAAGALLTVPAAWRPPYLLLLVPGAFLAAGGGTTADASPPADRATPPVATPRPTRTRALLAFGAGAAAVAALSVGGQMLVSGSWSPYAGERRGFSELEGFPGIDFPASEWSARVESKGNTSWVGGGALDADLSPALTGWNTVYLFLGRTVGLAPYFLPALVALFRRRAGTAARLAMAAGLAVPLAFMVLRPFNFYGGAGALANRYFLPVYPLFWFSGAGVVRCALTVLLAAPFLSSLWAAPAAYPLVAGEGYRYVSTTAHGLLPVETTQRHVKAPGRADVVHGTLWVRFLDGGLAPEDATAVRLLLRRGRRAEILVGSPTALASVTAEAVDGDTVAVLLDGPWRTTPLGPPERGTIALDRASARHPMWWTDDPFWIYRVELEALARPEVDGEAKRSGPIALRLLAAAAAPP